MGLKVFWMKRMAVATAVSALLLTVAVGGASAASKTVLLKADLHLKSGENPSAPGGIPADGSGKLLLLEDGTTLVKVDLHNLDPLRYPPGNACTGEVKAGAYSANGLHLEMSETGTSLDQQWVGTVVTGDKAEVRVRCQYNGQKHETRWSGTFGPI